VVAKQRGRESAGDMIRSLGLVMLIVLVVFLLARPPKSDEKELRVVDPSGDVRAFSEISPTVPVPGTLPGWRANVSDYTRDSGLLRVGWVTPKGEYAEYAATASPGRDFVRDITDRAPQTGTVEIAGVVWTQYRKDDAISLVRQVGGATVVLGTRRDSASLDELRVLAAALST
jgi:hypothetical protein